MAKKDVRPARRLRKGLFVTFEGPEGCGKSTHAKLLYGYLRSRGYPCLLTREPGGTKAGEAVRGVLLHARGARISSLAELFLFEACRAQIVEEVIAPALAGGAIVICDRYSDSTLCYQGYGGNVPLRAIEALDAVATGGLRPDLTILLDIDTVTGLRRAARKGSDRMEAKAIAYHRRVRSGYLALARKEPRRIEAIRVDGSIEETQARVRERVERVLRRY